MEKIMEGNANSGEPKPLSEVKEVISFNQSELEKWREELKKELKNHPDIRDDGYVQHCRDLISDLQSSTRILMWAYNLW